MMIKWNPIEAIRESIFLKLLLIVVATWLLVTVTIGFLIRHIIDHSPKASFPIVNRYLANQIVDQLGFPPDQRKAKILAKRFKIEIHYYGPRGRWTTSSNTSDFFSRSFPPRSRHFMHHEEQFPPPPFWKIPSPRRQYVMRIYRGNSTFLIDYKRRSWVRFRAKGFITFVAICSIILVVALFTLRWILRPVKGLIAGVKAVGEGNLDYRVPEETRDEMGELSRSFNLMTSQVQSMVESKEQLLLDVSHELRSPLTRIKIALEFLDDGNTKESIKEDIGMMESMVSEILETARMDSSHGVLNLEETNITQITQKVIQQTPQKIPEISLEVERDFILELDPIRVQTALKNLIENALKHSPKDSDPIQIQISEESENIVISIQDHGAGIPEKEIPFLFEPFYRIDKSRCRGTGGYGLGLPLTKKIIEAHHGRIKIKSEVGKGTEVIVTFPKIIEQS